MPSSDTERATYITEIVCPECEISTDLAHEGHVVPMDMEAPWPTVAHCPQCGESLPGDLAEVIGDVHVAEIVDADEVLRE